MKKLKYKAYIKSLKMIVDVVRLNFDTRTVEVLLGEDEYLHNDLSEYEFDEIHLMKFTGLYDEEGTEIYSGDIVEVWDKDETKTPYITEVYDMTYRGIMVDGHPAHVKVGLGGKRPLEHYCDYGYGEKYGVSCRIVGNKYIE